MIQREIRTLVTGDFKAEEFSRVFENNKSLKAVELSELLQADSSFDKNASPDLIVLCQSRRGTVLPAANEQLISMFPLAARVVLLGSYCEGERRSGKPLEGWHRRFWYQWPAFFGLFEFALLEGIDHPCQLPSTASASDLLLSEISFAEFADGQQPSIELNCRWDSERQWFVDLFEHFGCQVFLDRENSQSDILLVVRDSLDDQTVGEIKALCDRDRPVCLTLNFPRIQEWNLAFEMGIASLFGRPFVNSEVFYSILQLAPQSIRLAD